MTPAAPARSRRRAEFELPSLAPRPSYGAALSAVYSGQLARARLARVPLLFVATLQSMGILLLLRGVVDAGNDTTSQQVVAGATVLVVAFVALNLLAQRLGYLRGAGALDYYAALPVPASAVVLGTAASFATFTLPGAIVTMVVGALLYGLPLAHLWVLVPALLIAGASLSGVGALLGLLAPRPELATVFGQLAMSAVLFLAIIPPGRLPVLVRAARYAVPGTYVADALAATFLARPHWSAVAGELAAAAAIGVATLALAAAAFRRAVAR